MNKLALSLILLITSLSTAFGQYKYSEQAFKDGEKLVYNVVYKWSFINKEVATATFDVKAQEYHNKPSYLVSARATVSGSFSWFFDLDDRYTSILDGSTLLPLESTAEISENKYRFSSRYIYDWNNNNVTTYARKHSKPDTVVKNMPLTPESFDALGIFYNLRSTDMDKLHEGSTIELVLEDTIRKIKYNYLGREVKKVPRLGTFNTLKFSCELATTSGESFDDGDEFFMWISDDKNKIPLYFESPIRVGRVRAYIDRVENLKYPLSSKIK